MWTLLISGIAGAASSTRRSARAQRTSAARGSLACAAVARRIRASARGSQNCDQFAFAVLRGTKLLHVKMFRNEDDDG